MVTSTAPDVLGTLRAGLQTIAGSLATEAGLGSAPTVVLERPRDERFGDFSTNAAMMLAPILHSNPRSTAELIAGRARHLPGVAAVDIAGPGFINITMRDEWFLDSLRSISEAGDRFGSNVAAVTEPVLLEFVSANPLGPLVAASARHGSYGDSLARILRHAGYDVSTEFYVNDTGRQVERFGESIRARATGGEIPEGGYEGEYVIELAQQVGASADDDPADLGARGVELMVAAMKESLDRLGVEFDRFQSERALHDAGLIEHAIDQPRETGPGFDEDGAQMLRTTTWGDDKDRAVVRANGIPTYFAADVAYLLDKFRRVGNGGRLVYVLGADHHGYIGRLKAAASALGIDPDRCEIVIIQMVSLVEGGERRKMSKRSGDFVTAAELVDRIGIDATRFFMLQRSHDQPLDLDLEVAERRSDENPVFYVQYAHARLHSIVRKVDEMGLVVDRDPASALAATSLAAGELLPSEKRLVKRLADFPDVVRETAERRQPHRIVHYAHELASDVAKFYRDCRVTGEGIPLDLTARRLATCDAARGVLACSLGLIGVNAPERM